MLVPVDGRRDQSDLRARLLGSLSRSSTLEVLYLGVVHPSATLEERAKLAREIQDLADDEVPGKSRVEILVHEAVSDAVVTRASESDLVILGLRRLSRRQKSFGEIPVRVARETGNAILMISRRG